MEEKARICIKCNELKPIDDFPLNHVTKNGKKYIYPRTVCKVCENKRRDDKRARNGENEHRKVNHYIRGRRNQLKQYGLTPEDHSKMVYSHSNKCAICGTEANGKSLCVDHDHITGRVRGLLCNNCNLGLGNFKDSVENLLSAIGYLNRDKYE